MEEAMQLPKGTTASDLTPGFGVIADEVYLLSFHLTQAEAETAMGTSADARDLGVFPIEVDQSRTRGRKTGEVLARRKQSHRNLVVDGTDEMGHFAGDGETYPFVVFDIDAQKNIAGPFKTRADGEKAREAILAGAAPVLDSDALLALLEAMDEGKAPASGNQFKRISVSLDEGPSYQAYSRGETWNGFQCPYFPFEEAMKVTENPSIKGLKYEAETDRFVSIDPEYEDDPEYEAEIFMPTSILVDRLRIKVYPIGAFGWCWNMGTNVRMLHDLLPRIRISEVRGDVRFVVDQAESELTAEEDGFIKTMNQNLADASELALHAGCKSIQDAIGQTDGGVAGIFFSGGEQREAIDRALAEYMLCEYRELMPKDMEPDPAS
jgi:hypothetical protein